MKKERCDVGQQVKRACGLWLSQCGFPVRKGYVWFGGCVLGRYTIDLEYLRVIGHHVIRKRNYFYLERTGENANSVTCKQLGNPS